MTKAELVESVRTKAGFPTKVQAEKVLDATIAALCASLGSGHSITLTGFGSFKVAKRAARKGRNPRTGQEIKIPASKVVKFTPGKALKNSVK